MITLPKPRFAESNVPAGQSLEEYKEDVCEYQTHVLADAIDRVSHLSLQYKFSYISYV